MDDDFLRTLEGHPSLRSLRIKEEPITDSGLQSLHTLPLVYLDLDHCVVSEKACSDLQSALPNCEIAGPYLA